jgi:hypothetical protein
LGHDAARLRRAGLRGLSRHEEASPSHGMNKYG